MAATIRFPVVPKCKVYCADGGYVVNSGVATTVVGTPAFGTAFAYATNSAFIEWSSGTFTGAATGMRFYAANGGHISTGSSDFNNFFPGDSVGFIGPGGRMAGSTGVFVGGINTVADITIAKSTARINLNATFSSPQFAFQRVGVTQSMLYDDGGNIVVA